MFWYYRLTNYYQNHRRYVQSEDTTQLRGDSQSVSTIDNGNCKPITSQNGKAYYPCGLIANSVFNDTYQDLTLQNPANGGSSEPYTLSESGIAWSNEYKKYTNNPPGQPSDYLPPPNWAERYPNGYTEFPQLASDEHFQVWMRTAALPTFNKLWARNDDDVMRAGTYSVVVNMSESRPMSSLERESLTLPPVIRLPRQAIRRHQIHRHLHRLLDRWQTTVPRMGIRRDRGVVRVARAGRYRETLDQAEEDGRHVQ